MSTGTKTKNPHLLLSLFDLQVLSSPNRISDISGPASLGTRDGNMSVLLPRPYSHASQNPPGIQEPIYSSVPFQTRQDRFACLGQLIIWARTGAP